MSIINKMIGHHHKGKYPYICTHSETLWLLTSNWMLMWVLNVARLPVVLHGICKWPIIIEVKTQIVSTQNLKKFSLLLAGLDIRNLSFDTYCIGLWLWCELCPDGWGQPGIRVKITLHMPEFQFPQTSQPGYKMSFFYHPIRSEK